VTVPVAAFPPFTEAGLTSSLASDTTPIGITVSDADCEIEKYSAVIVTTSTDAAPAVEIGTVIEVCPPEMVTNGGTDATVGLLLEKCAVPRLVAGLPRVTVPVTICPLVTESLLSENVKRGLMVTIAVLAAPPKLAVIVTILAVVTAVVASVNFAELCPKGMVTVAGGCAAVESAETRTCAPPAWAELLMVTVPVSVDVPPVMELALRVSVERTGPPTEFTVSKALLDTLFAVATMVADPPAEELVSSVKSVETCPSGTVTEPGACTKLLVVVSDT
jgi:hypothetical protein